MGIDASLFVIAKWSTNGTGFVEHVLRLDRDSELWEQLHSIPTVKDWPIVQLPCGTWSVFSDGEEPVSKGGAEERGYLTEDSYGDSLVARSGAAVAMAATTSAFNHNVLRFVGEMFGDRDIVVFWH